MFSDHDETSPSIAAVSAPSVACSMLTVQQQKRLWIRRLSAAQRGCHTMKHAVWIVSPRTYYFGQMCMSVMSADEACLLQLHSTDDNTVIWLCGNEKQLQNEIHPSAALTFCYEPNRFIIWERMNCTVRWWRSDGRSITKDTSSAVLLSVHIT